MVRDDARRLDRCLASMKLFTDEIVVLDTGSLDESADVAVKHGARMQQIEWPNDFSAALNVLLAMVRTPWTLRLDSDEWIDADQAKEVRALIKDESASAYRLVRRDLNAQGGYSEIQVTRLWRTHEKAKYQGAVHETIPQSAFDAAWPGKQVFGTDVYFWHDGYVDDLQGKIQRNVQLLRKELEQSPENLEVEATLATTLSSAKDPEGMQRLTALVDKLLETELDRPSPQIALAFAMYMNSMPDQDVKSERGEQVIKKAVAWFPKNAAILYNAGILEKERGDLEASLKYFLKLEARAELGDYDRSMATPQEFVGEKLWNALGFVATQLGRADIVQRCHRRTLMSRVRR
jgi:tetratricopeptide (TPR) repeat protein